MAVTGAKDFECALNDRLAVVFCCCLLIHMAGSGTMVIPGDFCSLLVWEVRPGLAWNRRNETWGVST